MSTRVALIAVCLLAAGFARAQAPQQMSAPAQQQPTRQQQMMNYFAGDWKLVGTAKISPNTPGSPFTSTEHAEWLPGGFFLEIHSVMKGPLGDVHGTRMMEYNANDKVYTYNAYNSLGEHTMAIGTVQGDTWVWNAEEKINGVITKGRYTVTFISPDTYSFKSEVPQPGGKWATIMEGKATRTR
jgi:hypothetical protein